MFTSARYSYLALRLGLAAVFLWFGIDKFRHPDFWLTAGLPASVLSLVGGLGVSGLRFIFLAAVFETLTGLSLFLDIFSKFFSVLAIISLLALITVSGISSTTSYHLAIIGALLAVLFWPAQRARF